MYKKGGADLKLALNGTFPTSAGADYPGGYNLLPSYKTNGAPIDVALKGCRPIGIPLKDVGAGSYVIYRSGDKTYFVSGNQPTGGEELSHSPQYVFLNYKVLEVGAAAPKTSIQAVEELRGRICLAV